MSKNIKYLPLGKVCKEVYRYPSYYGIDYVEEGIPEIRGELILASGMLETASDQLRYISSKTAAKFPRTRLEPGDLVMSVRGTIGKIGLVPESLKGANMTANLIRIAPDRDLVEPKYLWRFMRTDRFIETLDHISPSTTIKTIRSPDLQAIPVPLLPLAEQRRIAAILDNADAIRRKRKQAIQYTEELLRATFLDMFGDPVTNPKDWKKEKLGDISKVQGGLQVTSKRRNLPVEVPYLRVANVYRDKLVLDEIKTIQVTQEELKRAALDTGDLLIVEGHGNNQEIGRSSVWNGSIVNCTHQNHLIRVRLDKAKAEPCFVSAFLNSEGGRRQLTKFGKTTSGLNTISTSNVKAAEVFLPPILLQQKYLKVRQEILGCSQTYEHQHQESDNLFNSLLQRAFRGEL